MSMSHILSVKQQSRWSSDCTFRVGMYNPFLISRLISSNVLIVNIPSKTTSHDNVKMTLK